MKLINFLASILKNVINGLHYTRIYILSPSFINKIVSMYNATMFLIEYFNMYKFLMYFSLFTKVLLYIIIILCIMILFSFTNYNIDSLTQFTIISAPLSIFLDEDSIFDFIDWIKSKFRVIGRKLISKLNDLVEEEIVQIEEPINKSTYSIPNQDIPKGYGRYPTISELLFMLLFILIFGYSYKHWDDFTVNNAASLYTTTI